jgi:hypothetical protein
MWVVPGECAPKVHDFRGPQKLLSKKSLFMAEAQFNGKNIVDWTMGAFNTQVAIVCLYNTKLTPRTPIGRIYAEHRACSNADDLMSGRLSMDDPRLAELGLNQTPLNEQDRHDLSLTVRALRRVKRALS